MSRNENGSQQQSTIGHTPKEASVQEQAMGAMFYGSASLLIIFVNKLVLTSWHFPSFTFLALSQFLCTIIILGVLRMLGYVNFPHMSLNTVRQVFPLPLIFALNTVVGLGGTKHLNLPMFTVLRRFTIVFTMIAEYFILGRQSSGRVQLSVLLLIVGALVAAADDLSFQALGYTLVFVNNILSAINCVVMKQKLVSRQSLGTFGILFYNSLLSFPFALAVFLMRSDAKSLSAIANFPNWTNPVFLLLFILASVMGCILNFSIIYCTKVNSALTTMIVGSLKNVLSTYAGLFLGGDYLFTIQNFVGLNLSITGSIYYSYITFYDEQARKQQAQIAVQQEKEKLNDSLPMLSVKGESNASSRFPSGASGTV